MATENQITLVGNLTDDPELKYTPNGAAVATFSVAVSRRVRNEGTGQWEDADTSFFRVNCWRSLAENVAESLTRGTRVVISGRLRQRSWQNQDGERRSVVEVEADEVGPSLKWATARVERTRSGGGPKGGDWTAGAPIGAGVGMEEETPLDG